MADQKATVTSRVRIAAERSSGALTWMAIGGLGALVVFGGPSREYVGAAVPAAGPARETVGATAKLPVETLVGEETQSETTFSVAEAKLKVKRGARGSASKSSPAAAEPKTEPPAATPAPAVAAPSAIPSLPQGQDAAPQTKTATPAATPPEPVEPPFWSDAEIAAARAECTGIMAGVEADWSVAPPMRSTACGAPGPISLRSIGTARVDVAPAAITNCQTAAALARWMDTHVQPAAKERFGATVSRIAIAGSYTCRNRYGQKAAPLSEHALANAVDISSFKLTDGRTITVSGSWGPTARSIAAAEAAAKAASAAPAANVKPEGKADKVAGTRSAASEARMQLGVGAASEKAQKAAAKDAPPLAKAESVSVDAQFLRAIHAGACHVFGTVLGPEANEAHRDHFHLDMKHRRRSAFCE